MMSFSMLFVTIALVALCGYINDAVEGYAKFVFLGGARSDWYVVATYVYLVVGFACSVYRASPKRAVNLSSLGSTQWVKSQFLWLDPLLCLLLLAFTSYLSVTVLGAVLGAISTITCSWLFWDMLSDAVITSGARLRCVREKVKEVNAKQELSTDEVSELASLLELFIGEPTFERHMKKGGQKPKPKSEMLLVEDGGTIGSIADPVAAAATESDGSGSAPVVAAVVTGPAPVGEGAASGDAGEVGGNSRLRRVGHYLALPFKKVGYGCGWLVKKLPLERASRVVKPVTTPLARLFSKVARPVVAVTIRPFSWIGGHLKNFHGKAVSKYVPAMKVGAVAVMFYASAPFVATAGFLAGILPIAGTVALVVAVSKASLKYCETAIVFTAGDLTLNEATVNAIRILPHDIKLLLLNLLMLYGSISPFTVKVYTVASKWCPAKLKPLFGFDTSSIMDAFAQTLGDELGHTIRPYTHSELLKMITGIIALGVAKHHGASPEDLRALSTVLLGASSRMKAIARFISNDAGREMLAQLCSSAAMENLKNIIFSVRSGSGINSRSSEATILVDHFLTKCYASGEAVAVIMAKAPGLKFSALTRMVPSPDSTMEPSAIHALDVKLDGACKRNDEYASVLGTFFLMMHCLRDDDTTSMTLRDSTRSNRYFAMFSAVLAMFRKGGNSPLTVRGLTLASLSVAVLYGIQHYRGRQTDSSYSSHNLRLLRMALCTKVPMLKRASEDQRNNMTEAEELQTTDKMCQLHVDRTVYEKLCSSKNAQIQSIVRALSPYVESIKVGYVLSVSYVARHWKDVSSGSGTTIMFVPLVPCDAEGVLAFIEKRIPKGCRSSESIDLAHFVLLCYSFVGSVISPPVGVELNDKELLDHVVKTSNEALREMVALSATNKSRVVDVVCTKSSTKRVVSFDLHVGGKGGGRTDFKQTKAAGQAVRLAGGRQAYLTADDDIIYAEDMTYEDRIDYFGYDPQEDHSRGDPQMYKGGRKDRGDRLVDKELNDAFPDGPASGGGRDDRERKGNRRQQLEEQAEHVGLDRSERNELESLKFQLEEEAEILDRENEGDSSRMRSKAKKRKWTIKGSNFTRQARGCAFNGNVFKCSIGNQSACASIWRLTNSNHCAIFPIDIFLPDADARLNVMNLAIPFIFTPDGSPFLTREPVSIYFENSYTIQLECDLGKIYEPFTRVVVYRTVDDSAAMVMGFVCLIIPNTVSLPNNSYPQLQVADISDQSTFSVVCPLGDDRVKGIRGVTSVTLSVCPGGFAYGSDENPLTHGHCGSVVISMVDFVPRIVGVYVGQHNSATQVKKPCFVMCGPDYPLYIRAFIGCRGFIPHGTSTRYSSAALNSKGLVVGPANAAFIQMFRKTVQCSPEVLVLLKQLQQFDSASLDKLTRAYLEARSQILDRAGVRPRFAKLLNTNHSFVVAMGFQPYAAVRMDQAASCIAVIASLYYKDRRSAPLAPEVCDRLMAPAYYRGKWVDEQFGEFSPKTGFNRCVKCLPKVSDPTFGTRWDEICERYIELDHGTGAIPGVGTLADKTNAKPEKVLKFVDTLKSLKTNYAAVAKLIGICENSAVEFKDHAKILQNADVVNWLEAHGKTFYRVPFIKNEPVDIKKLERGNLRVVIGLCLSIRVCFLARIASKVQGQIVNPHDEALARYALYTGLNLDDVQERIDILRSRGPLKGYDVDGWDQSVPFELATDAYKLLLGMTWKEAMAWNILLNCTPMRIQHRESNTDELVYLGFYFTSGQLLTLLCNSMMHCRAADLPCLVLGEVKLWSKCVKTDEDPQPMMDVQGDDNMSVQQVFSLVQGNMRQCGFSTTPDVNFCGENLAGEKTSLLVEQVARRVLRLTTTSELATLDLARYIQASSALAETATDAKGKPTRPSSPVSDAPVAPLPVKGKETPVIPVTVKSVKAAPKKVVAADVEVLVGSGAEAAPSPSNKKEGSRRKTRSDKAASAPLVNASGVSTDVVAADQSATAVVAASSDATKA